MLSAPAFGAVLGVCLGIVNAAASLFLYWRARHRSQVAFAQLVLGGMLVRMAVVLGVVTIVLALTPIAHGPFVLGLLAAFVLGLVLEAIFILKQRPLSAEG